MMLLYLFLRVEFWGSTGEAFMRRTSSTCRPDYIISDTPMTPEQWARERAEVIDGTVIEKKLPPSQQVIDDAASLALPLNSTPRGAASMV